MRLRPTAPRSAPASAHRLLARLPFPGVWRLMGELNAVSGDRARSIMESSGILTMDIAGVPEFV